MHDSARVKHPMGQRVRMTAREQIEAKGLQPITSVGDLTCDVWESDRELTEFLEDVHASRHANVG